MAEPTAMLVLDFHISDEQKKKLLDGLCRLITRCDIQALKVGVKSPPDAGVAMPDSSALIDAAFKHSDLYEGREIPANETRAAINNAFFAGATFATRGVAGTHAPEPVAYIAKNPNGVMTLWWPGEVARIPMEGCELIPLFTAGVTAWCTLCGKSDHTEAACPTVAAGVKVDAPAAPFNPAHGLPSDAPGAWKCSRCGFRGFWSGGPHECAAGVTPTDGGQP